MGERSIFSADGSIRDTLSSLGVEDRSIGASDRSVGHVLSLPVVVDRSISELMDLSVSGADMLSKTSSWDKSVPTLVLGSSVLTGDSKDSSGSNISGRIVGCDGDRAGDELDKEAYGN